MEGELISDSLISNLVLNLCSGDTWVRTQSSISLAAKQSPKPPANIPSHCYSNHKDQLINHKSKEGFTSHSTSNTVHKCPLPLYFPLHPSTMPCLCQPSYHRHTHVHPKLRGHFYLFTVLVWHFFSSSFSFFLF